MARKGHSHLSRHSGNAVRAASASGCYPHAKVPIVLPVEPKKVDQAKYRQLSGSIPPGAQVPIVLPSFLAEVDEDEKEPDHAEKPPSRDGDKYAP
jgi:hypothetical protein